MLNYTYIDTYHCFLLFEAITCERFMFIRLTSFLLIVVLFSKSFTPLILFIGYSLNKEFIATTFCVNKNKPELRCKGKCYLNKKIKQAEEKEQKQSSSSFKDSIEAFISEQVPFRCFTFQTDEYLTSSIVAYFFSPAKKIFQPPKLS